MTEYCITYEHEPTANEFHMNGKEINVLVIDGVKFRIIYQNNEPYKFEKVEV